MAAAAQGVEDYTSYIALVHPASGEIRRLDETPGEMHYPLGWLRAGELLVMMERYTPIQEGDLLKQYTTEAALYRVNVQTGQWNALAQEENWIGVIPSLSPEGGRLAFTSNEARPTLLVMDVNDHIIRVLGNFGFTPQWSPDGQWLATTWYPEESNVSVYVVRSEWSEGQKVFEGVGEYVSAAWLPDSEHILVTVFDEQNERETTSLFLVSALDGSSQPVKLPGLDANTLISGISVRPVTPEDTPPSAIPTPYESLPPVETPPPGTTTYTVQEGDTLFKIADQFGLTVEMLMALNGLTQDAIIFVGQVLVVVPAVETPPQDFPVQAVIPFGLGSVNVRSGPGTDYDVSGQLSEGASVMVLGIAEDMSWYRL